MEYPVSTLKKENEISSESIEEWDLIEPHNIQQVLGNGPSWFTRWGISVVLALLLIPLALTWIIQYPDIVQATITITSKNPPIRMPALVSGRIEKLFVQDGATADAGELLAVIASSTNWQDVIYLEEQIRKWEQDTHMELTEGLTLGNLQAAYFSFKQKKYTYDRLMQNKVEAQKVTAIQQQISNLNALNESLNRQKSSMHDEISFIQKNLSRYQELKEKKFASKKEVEDVELQLLKEKRRIETLSTNFANNLVRISELQIQIQEILQKRENDLKLKWVEVVGSLRQLRSSIKEWKRKYLLIAPYAGKIAFSQDWYAHNFINSGEEILAIIQDGENAEAVIGKAILPFAGAGQVELGQYVQIRLDAYPYQEYGILSAHVEKIAQLPNKEGYLVEVEIPSALITELGQSIKLIQEMKGTAHITTKERRLLERILGRLVSQFSASR